MKILITVTGKGLGGALAACYLENGHTVYGISRNRNKGLEKYTGFHFISQDLSDFDEMEKTIPGFLKKAGRLNLAVLNAGVLAEIKDMKECSLAEIKRIMDINVWSNKILVDLLFSNLESIDQFAGLFPLFVVNQNRKLRLKGNLFRSASMEEPVNKTTVFPQ